MKSSKHIKQFKALAQDAADAFDLIGSALIVEKIPEEEMKKGNIILHVPDSYKETLGDSRPIWVRQVSNIT